MSERELREGKAVFDPGFDIRIRTEDLAFEYGSGVFGPAPEKRRLDDIRGSLSNPWADGPPVVYAVAMDIGKEKDRDDLLRRNLLYGAMIFAKGQIGEEPVRSQGHVHAVSRSCGTSTPEVYEIWLGDAIVYMQEYDGDEPGRCIAVKASEGDVVIVPPGWAHCTINANADREMAFGAWCVRDYGFDYTGVRAHGGLAYFPIVKDGRLDWIKNPNYGPSSLEIREARSYPEFGLAKGVPVYTQYERDRSRFEFVCNPKVADAIWANFTP